MDLWELAERAGTSQPALARYETGAALPTLPTLERLLLGCGRRLDLEPGRTLLDLAGCRREAEEILGAPVDVATPDMLKERIRREVLNEALAL